MSVKNDSGKKPNAKAFAADVQKRAGEIAHDAAEVAHKAANAAGKGAKVAIDAAAEAGKAVSDFANKAGRFLDSKSREYLAKEFAKNQPLALATVARLRKAQGSASPAAIIDALSAEFTLNEKGVPAQSAKFLAAATNYVLTLNEIYGKKVRDENRRQLLLYVLLAANSNAASIVAQVGMTVFLFLKKRFAAVAVVTLVADWVKKYSGKATWIVTLARLGGIPNAGRKSASWIVITAARKILGEPPKTWPAAKAAAARKPAAKKPVTKKPTAKKPSA